MSEIHPVRLRSVAGIFTQLIRGGISTHWHLVGRDTSQTLCDLKPDLGSRTLMPGTSDEMCLICIGNAAREVTQSSVDDQEG